MTPSPTKMLIFPTNYYKKNVLHVFSNGVCYIEKVAFTMLRNLPYLTPPKMLINHSEQLSDEKNVLQSRGFPLVLLGLRSNGFVHILIYSFIYF